MAYSQQGRAITGRPQYYDQGVKNRPPYYPTKYPDMSEPVQEAIPQGILPSRPAPKKRLPGPGPGGIDTPNAMAEGQINVEGVPIFGNLQEGSQAQQKGDVLGAVKGYGKAALDVAMLPFQPFNMILGQAYQSIKGSASSPDPTGVIGSGPGAGLPAGMGLPAPGALGPDSSQSKGMPSITGGPLAGHGIDLADLDIGDFGGAGGDDGGLGMGPSGQGIGDSSW